MVLAEVDILEHLILFVSLKESEQDELSVLSAMRVKALVRVEKLRLHRLFRFYISSALWSIDSGIAEVGILVHRIWILCSQGLWRGRIHAALRHPFDR